LGVGDRRTRIWSMRELLRRREAGCSMTLGKLDIRVPASVSMRRPGRIAVDLVEGVGMGSVEEHGKRRDHRQLRPGPLTGVKTKGILSPAVQQPRAPQQRQYYPQGG